jgi:hypothetical protein
VGRPDQDPSRQDRGGVALPELQGALRVGDVAGGRARGARRQRSQRRDSAAALTQTGTLMWRRRMLTASTPAASSRATGGRQMAPAQRPSRRTPLEGNHRGHRVATRQGGGSGEGGRGEGGKLKGERQGSGGGEGENSDRGGWGVQSGLSNHSCLYSVNKNRQTDLWSGCLGEI